MQDRTNEISDAYAAEVKRLRDALTIIARGYTNQFPGAPDVMHESPSSFRAKMWSWSQAVAQAALEQRHEEEKSG